MLLLPAVAKCAIRSFKPVSEFTPGISATAVSIINARSGTDRATFWPSFHHSSQSCVSMSIRAFGDDVTTLIPEVDVSLGCGCWLRYHLLGTRDKSDCSLPIYRRAANKCLQGTSLELTHKNSCCPMWSHDMSASELTLTTSVTSDAPTFSFFLRI